MSFARKIFKALFGLTFFSSDYSDNIIATRVATHLFYATSAKLVECQQCQHSYKKRNIYVLYLYTEIQNPPQIHRSGNMLTLSSFDIVLASTLNLLTSTLQKTSGNNVNIFQISESRQSKKMSFEKMASNERKKKYEFRSNVKRISSDNMGKKAISFLERGGDLL